MNETLVVCGVCLKPEVPKVFVDGEWECGRELA